MKTITVLSGKGGVGKSTITSCLSVLLARKRNIVAVDCDVDAPNLGLALGLEEKDFSSWKKISTNYKARLITDKCMSCRKCLDVCNFSTISWDQNKNKPIINSLLCEGCGSCHLVCPAGAIELKRVQNASVGQGKTRYGFPIVSGQLKMGESGSGNVVDVVRFEAEKLARKAEAELILCDAAAGIGCPVVASVRGSDYVIVVIEPNPASFRDAKRALGMVDYFRIPYGIVINRWDLNRETSRKIEAFAMKSSIPVLGKVPYDRRFVDSLVNLKPAVIWDKGLEPIFSKILISLPNYIVT
jgi:MinD superfamily P-loop ATPase